MKILGKREEISKIEKALNKLRKVRPGLFEVFTKNIKTIKVLRDSDTDHNELIFKNRSYVINHSILESKTNYLVSLFAHEAKHVQQYLRGVKNIDSRAERMAYMIQKKALIELGETSLVKWLTGYYREKYCIDSGKKPI